MKKLKLKKESIISLDKDSMKHIVGGDLTDAYVTCLYTLVDTYISCTCDKKDEYDQGDGSYNYCGTLKDCGTGMAYCVTYDCFFNSKPCHYD